MIEGILLCISLGIFYLVGVHLIRANRIIYEVYRLLKFISENKKVTADNKNNETAQQTSAAPGTEPADVGSLMQFGMGAPVEYYEVNFDQVQNIQDVKDLLSDLNLKFMLFPGEQINEKVSRPDLWVKVDEAA